MRSLRSSSLVVSLALVAAASACKKEGDGAAGGGGAAGATGSDLNVVPADSDFVMGVDLSKVRDSALFKEYGTKMLEQATKDISEFKAQCGFDPVETIKTVSMGIKMLPGDKGRGSIVFHSTAPRDKLKACLEKSKPDAEAKGTKIVIEGDIAYLTPKDEKTYVALTYLGSDGVVALINDRAWTKDTVSQAIAGKGSVKDSKPFMDAYKAIKQGQTMWFYVNGAAEFAQQAKGAGLDANAFIGSVNVTDAVSAEFRARLKSADAATAAAKMVESQLGQVKMMVPNVSAKAEGNDLKLNVDMSNKEIKSLMSMFGGMLGGLGGGGGGAMPEPAPAPEAPTEAPAPAPAQ